MIGAKNLGLSYPRHQVLDGISFTLEPGQLCAVIGANGSGKSTLLRCLAGLHPASSGQRFGASELPPAQRREQLAYLPQRLPLPPALSARQLAMLGADAPQRWLASAAAQQRAAQALATLDLQTLAERDCRTLSGGEYRRAALAACLAQGAPIMLLDEPCAGLDLPHAGALMGGLRRWIVGAPDRHAALVVLHDLNLAAQWADRLLLLGQGQLLADDRPETVLASEALELAFGGELQRFRHPEHGHLVVLGPSR